MGKTIKDLNNGAGGDFLKPKDLAKLVVEAASDKKAEDIVVLDVSKLLVITNYFIIASGKSTRQTRIISENIREKLREKKVKPLGVEGETEGHWILLDYGDVVAHIFTPEVREYYRLESLWKDAPRLKS